MAKADFLGFPPGSAESSFIYPTLNIDYAVEIARDWNTHAHEAGYAGFVTRFDLDDAFARRYPIHTVGHRGTNQELWVPATETHAFNEHIRGYVTIVETFVGDKCEETIDFASRLPVRVAQRLYELGLN